MQVFDGVLNGKADVRELSGFLMVFGLREELKFAVSIPVEV